MMSFRNRSLEQDFVIGKEHIFVGNDTENMEGRREQILNDFLSKF